jgi:hypothetical protein
MIPLAGNAGDRASSARFSGVAALDGAENVPGRPLKMQEMPDTSEQMPG